MQRSLDLIPHRPPWLVIDRVVALETDRVVAEKRLGMGDPWVGSGELPELLAIELVAQTAACLMGGRRAADERSGHHGYIVALRGWKFQSRAQAGDTLTLIVTRGVSLGALVSFHGEVQRDGELLASGDLSCAVRFD